MSFISWQFSFFLALVVALYWRLPHVARKVLLLAASYTFYGFWDVRFLALLLTSTAIDFFCGLAVAGQRRPLRQVVMAAGLPPVWLAICAASPGLSGAVALETLGAAALFPIAFALLYQALWSLPEARQRRAFLLLSVLTNLGVLGFFKYFNFFTASAVSLCRTLGWEPGWTLPHIILPIGISFYTFQSISYSVDIFRGKARPSAEFLTFATYLSFFPQLVAGPIERPNDLLPQFQAPAVFELEGFHRGIRLILIGLFKKIFVADNCALLANHAFASGQPLNAYWAGLGVLAFAFQIYGDFSGYTDIARGSARLLGIRLNHNFHFPYFARSPSDFWQRWHITLSAWFRDYVYIPLGGNRGGTFQTLRNLWITMLLAGLWHGASWTFVLWGAYHALLLTGYRLVPTLDRLAETNAPSSWRRPASMALMFCLTLFGWAIFRSGNIHQFTGWLAAWGHWEPSAAVSCLRPFLWCLFHVVPLLLLQAVTWKGRDEVEWGHVPWPARGLAYAAMFLAVVSSSAGDQEFIYFQF